MANNVKSQLRTLSTKNTLPLSTSTVVTISATSGESAFVLSAAITDDFKVGSWIWDTTNDKLYKVKELDREAGGGTIFGTFDNTLSSAAMAYIKSKDTKVVKIFISAVADTEIDGQTLTAGSSVNYNSTDERGSFGSNWVTPHICDGTVGDILYDVIKY